MVAYATTFEQKNKENRIHESLKGRMKRQDKEPDAANERLNEVSLPHCAAPLPKSLNLILSGEVLFFSQ